MDIIHLLSDSVANQIAAGEVVQRPSSVVKELMENSIDAGAKQIQVILKNVGKTMIQVIDNGKGMSSTDLRMAFERHATSKISSAQDLFNIHTLGFRGEALPSIASVAEVEVKSRQTDEELGCSIFIAAGEVKSQEMVNSPKGTNVIVKNLFYNIPARRKFLKSDSTELRNITTEFLRIVLANPDISFSLNNNGNMLYDLPASILRQRITNVFGKSINSKLIPIQSETGLAKIQGFICSPEHIKKSYGEQFFFVNDRFMKHSFFHKAVMEAYSGLIGIESIPSYFIYFTINPADIDVNIHPTKTEIKFQNESDFFPILLATIREALGKFNITPPLDFDTEGQLEYQPIKTETPYVPRIDYNPNYNPFHYHSITPLDSDFEVSSPGQFYHTKPVPTNWDILFDGLKEESEPMQTTIPEVEKMNPTIFSTPCHFQLKGRYIVTPVSIGLMLIDQKRAHERILFEKYLTELQTQQVIGQKALFPEILEVSTEDFILLEELSSDLGYLGFELNAFGKNCFAIQATPPDLSYNQVKKTLMELLEHYKHTEGNIREKVHERMALALAKATSIHYNSNLTCEEMDHLTSQLFSCKIQNHTAEGKTILHILKYEDVNSWFK